MQVVFVKIIIINRVLERRYGYSESQSNRDWQLRMEYCSFSVSRVDALPRRRLTSFKAGDDTSVALFDMAKFFN